MNNFIKNKREILAVVIWLIVVAVMIYFVILPLTARINNTKNQIQEELLNQQISRSHLSELPKTQQQYLVLEKNINATDVLLDKADAVKLIERLEDIANQSNVEIEIAVQETVQKAVPAQVSKDKAAENEIISQLSSQNFLRFNITLNGDYNSIVKFISVIEKFEYYSDILKLEIKKDDQKNVAKANSSSNGSGFLDPFNAKTNNVEQKKETDDKPQAIIDIVFYTK